jgi:SAM-dependent methyltransferase
MPLTPDRWHDRFHRQAGWTASLRNYLYGQFSVQHANRILEVGSGTGVICKELSDMCSACVYGLDINLDFTRLAMRNVPQARFSLADASFAPFPAHAFELTLCHYLFLWVDDPLDIISEMVRITQPGGAVAAMAEPDYGGRIDYPPDLEILGDWQQESLRAQGADPRIGRRLRRLFHQAGLVNIETGVLGGNWSDGAYIDEMASEWQILQSDLGDQAEFTHRAATLQALDRSARQDGSRILFVPTFFAWGVVP